ncbi:ATP-binding cassette domain-containing protein [Campylobacter ureolyticus]|uniref:ATP-binding cassette domain-containing protein n=1 Tax=Campylobacter ureolyticus TaxID=827 RepID=A0A9Q4PTR4_9BACT|nr:ATP-binding cassette domain-containing protein [Campylobacter ureolyticus]MCZ6133892.1 ATP-binding cassette domain-containing protein [Campylobacter ureolyticus]MCZ6161633.1 ATP-binding cassette domain-containing protein [Campylobacter ureolyticus]MCZ6170778.1 ATP-binding cassette domain-containing protein [Campylobacter ureolyticus]
MIKAVNLEKKFKNTIAINNISFEAKSGLITGLVGPDGAGKTTLLRLLVGLMKPTSGNLEVLGFEMPNSSKEFLSSIGYMPQNFGLYEELSCYENLKLYATLQDIKNQDDRINELLEFTKLAPFKNRFAKNLSGGMKQKLALSCALIRKPKLLLLDEPGVGVDPIARKELWKMAKELQKDGITIIWATSYQDEANLCDEVIMLNEGEILLHENPQNAKKILKNRVFLINIDDKKTYLNTLKSNPDILDASILGDDIKFSIKKNAKFEIPKNAKTIEPSFEDLFLDLLNPKNIKISSLKTDILKSDKPVIQAINLTKKFGDFTVTDSINFSVNSGEIFGLLGPNGAGKSTTFKMLCGLLKPTSGKALVLGQDLYEKAQETKQKIGYMAQKFSLYQNLNLTDNLDFFAGIYGLKGKQKKEKIYQMIETFEFKKYLKSTVLELPLGIKQRLSLACAIMHEPLVLFLDEPTSGVDSVTRREFWTHINTLSKNGVSVMVTTHLMDEAELCDKIMIIYKGKDIKTGSPSKIKSDIKNNATMEEAFIKLVKDYED